MRGCWAAWALALALAAGGARAEVTAIETARVSLERAAVALSEAESGPERLAALGRAIQAHEAALEAYRTGLRDMATRESGIRAGIEADGARLEALFGALQSLSLAPGSALLAFPGGPVAAMRAAGTMAEITPVIDARVAALRERLGTLRQVRASQDAARVEARGTLAALQDLRTQTAEALRRRRLSEAATRQELAAQAEAAARRAATLGELAASVAGAALADMGVLVSFSEARGFIRPPVLGRVVAGFGAPDPWGRPGFGLTLAAPAYAQVTAPWDGTVRYAGPLIDYGQVVILEVEAGTLIVLAGLARVDRVVGETVLSGEPLGDLGGPVPETSEFLLAETTDRDAIGEEVLYMELRRGGEVVDPALWFDLTQKESGK